MRPDTVAQILTFSNVHPHSNMVVMETTQGLLLTAMLERMGGVHGCPCQLALPRFTLSRTWQTGAGVLWRLSSQVSCLILANVFVAKTSCCVCVFGPAVEGLFPAFIARLAVDNSSHLSQHDKAALLEYPLHRIGSKFPAILQSSVVAGIKSATAVPLEDCGEDVEESEVAGIQTTSPDSATDPESDDELTPQPAKKARLSQGSEGCSVSKSDAILTGDHGNKEERGRRRQEREERYAAAERLLQQKKMDGYCTNILCHVRW